MKRFFISLVTLTTLAAAAPAYNGWGVYLAAWNTADLDDAVGPGLKISMEMVPDVQLELRTAYFDSLDGHQQDLSILPLEANLTLQYEVGTSMTGYGGVGLGYYLLDGGRKQAGATLDPQADDEVGFYGLLGLEMPVKENAGLFAEVQYRFLEASDADAYGNQLDTLDLSGIGVNIGLMINW
ncbi:MAG: outer membrane beta-barrel protein [Verrucomicrobia bacterium]|nr:outer membrane beta-barrel protein [Kiritimatiellia bacterium]MCP5488340.1 outer membrane beta-barrel protein [Verrucomicrobiota bacterium]